MQLTNTTQFGADLGADITMPTSQIAESEVSCTKIENCSFDKASKNSDDDMEEKDTKTPKRKRGRPPEEKKITCDICGKIFQHRFIFLVHQRSHLGIKEFECEYCHRSFVQKGQLEVHRRIHTGEKPFKCPHCPKSFRLRTILDGHVFRHTGKGTECPQCQSVFPTKAQAKQHLQIVHSTEKSYVCQICGASYKMQRGLKMHLKNHDKRVCVVCKKEFHTLHALMTHRRIHDLNHKCNFCDRSYKTPEELDAHNKLRGRAFQCTMCCYSFNKAEYLNNHNRRDHWKEMGLEQLPRKIVKPGEGKASLKKLKAQQALLSAAETIKQIEPTVVQSESPTPTWYRNIDLVSPKSEELDNHDKSDSNQQFSTFCEDEINEVEGESNVEPLSYCENEIKEVEGESNIEPQTNCEKKIEEVEGDSNIEPQTNRENEIKEVVGESNIESQTNCEKETEEVEGESIAEQQSYCKNEIKDEGELNIEPETLPLESTGCASTPEEAPPEDNWMDFVETKMDSSSESEDDEVPLAKLVLRKPEQPSKLERKKSVQADRKKQSPKSSDEHESVIEETKSRGRRTSKRNSLRKKQPPESSDERDTGTEETKPKSRRTSKRESPQKKPSRNQTAQPDRKKQPTESSDEHETGTEEAKPKGRRTSKRNGPRKKNRSVKCKICEEVLPGRIAFRKHMKSVHADAKLDEYITKPMICEVCGKSYQSISSLMIHRGQHGQLQRFKCDECPKTFVFQSLLENHKRMEHRKERHICALCGKQYKYRVDLRHHLLRHEDARPFKCDKCPQTFTHSTALHDHEATHRQAVFRCNICGKDFRYVSSLRMHKRIHNRDNFVRCEVCHREFSEKAVLKKHMIIHSADRQMECVVCSKVYYRKCELMIHQAKEHTNHPLIGKTITIRSCNMCSSEFTKDSHLRTHMLIHGDEYMFKCELCKDQKFKQKVGLRNHWIRFHHMELPKKKLQETKEAIDCTVKSETTTVHNTSNDELI